MQRPPGYTYGTPLVPLSPVSLREFEWMKATAMFTDEDVRYLRMSLAILADQTAEIVEKWYEFVGSQPQLIRYYSTPAGMPLQDYLARTFARFQQWIIDTAEANYDQDWLNYQYEIGLRHHHTKKNRTDAAPALPHIHYRYMVPLIYPIVATLKPFLARKGHSPEEVEKMWEAWLKAVLLSVALWSQPYVKPGEY
ncbi:protoglobin domain-containing protein [Symbiobacterium terraclitae]|uniref:protoglobin domain-containing protein n=1 Tax=Symbiobacterium terraclitae TaxID=557451 RepID=UPI0035B55862